MYHIEYYQESFYWEHGLLVKEKDIFVQLVEDSLIKRESFELHSRFNIVNKVITK